VGRVFINGYLPGYLPLPWVNTQKLGIYPICNIYEVISFYSLIVSIVGQNISFYSLIVTIVGQNISFYSLIVSIVGQNEQIRENEIQCCNLNVATLHKWITDFCLEYAVAVAWCAWPWWNII